MPVTQKELDRRMQAFEDACRGRGLKVTHQRTEVFRELAATDEHPDAEALYRRVRRRVPAMSLDTVYRTLRTLEELGVVRRAEVDAGASRFDANVQRHDHFICTRCGMVRDVQVDAEGALSLPASVKSLGRVTSTQVLVRGICRNCMKTAD